MNLFFKKISTLILMLSLSLGFTACDNQGEVKAKSDNKPKNEETYSKELLKYFPSVEGMVLKYSGTAEYSHSLTLNKIMNKQNSVILDLKGEIHDVSDGEGSSKEDLIMETQYIVNKNSVKEIQKNVKRRYSQSIVREQTVLKFPIKEGNIWSESVEIDNKQYTATTKIVEISKDNQNKNIVKTEMVVKEIKPYPENTYKEIKIFKEGKGLAEFQNLILQKKEPLEFRYKLFEEENKQ
ncbi:hypothetical protein RBU49_17025 [Clostridium sp. MB40-C1]|uniref:hypothetical protein n=1 Tax=Clostridium sp. MB40-C1 TaxID=3070996 RepID=UPI0027E0D36A|nr:hypothetical protein [Clostridium sp. MB40-C1]WMJ80486.1 hypothetical protein RBU49_17025 [Clostridium sp. MB40-C1]